MAGGLCDFVGWMLADKLGIRMFEPSQYKEDRIGYWKHNHLTQWYAGMTASGFHVGYQLTCQVTRTDDEAFEQNRMLEESAENDLVDQFNVQAIRPWINTRLFLMHHWINPFVYGGKDYIHPGLQAYFKHDDGQVRFDPNRCKFIDWVNAQQRYRINGCDVRLLRMDIFCTPYIARNYSMLDPSEVAQAIQVEPFQRYREKTIVAALWEAQQMRDSLRLDQTDQRHKGYSFSIDSTLYEGNIRLSWKITEELPSGGRLIGAYESNGFSMSPYETIEKGTRIVDTKTDGLMADHLEAGKARFYTFAIVWQQNTSINPFAPNYETNLRSPIRFAIRVPTALDDSNRIKAEIEMKQLLQKLNPPPQPSEHERMLNEALGQINAFKSISKLLHEKHNEGVAEIKASAASAKDKRERLETWDRLFEQLRMTYDI